MEKKEDRRVKITKRMLKDALIELLKKKDIYHVSIRELCDSADVNRTTFYKYYGSQFDLLADMENDLLELISKAIEKNEANPEKIVAAACRYLEDNLEFARLIINNNVDPNFANRLFAMEALKQRAMESVSVNKTAAEIVETIATKVEQTKTRSAWDCGVKAYAEELCEELREAAEGGYVEAWELSNRRLLEKAMLNGADSWSQYSEGGCSLCYDGQIAERLCAPWELRKTDNGRKDPNPSESWIDVQSRALFQAAQLVLNAAF